MTDSTSLAQMFTASGGIVREITPEEYDQMAMLERLRDRIGQFSEIPEL